MNSLINFRLSVVLLSSVVILLFSCSKDTSVNKSNKTEIKSWKFGSKVATISGTNININLAYGTDITLLQVDVELSAGAKIIPDPTNSIDYTNPVNFKVTAEDGKTSKIYKVTVNFAKNNKAEIKSWKFGSKIAKIRGTNITTSVAYGIDITSLKANIELSAEASISPDPTNIIDYTNPVNFKVTAQDGTTNDYKVVVSAEDPIISWTAGWRDDLAYTANINQRIGKVDIDVNSADFDIKVNLSAGVTISPDPNSIIDWTDQVTFTTTKGSKTKVYTVKVKVDGKDIIKVTNANIKNTIKDEIVKYGKTANYNYIDVSRVTDMNSLFERRCDFNGDISKWDVSNVTNMVAMFKFNNAVCSGNSKFNQDIGDWDVSNVTNMSVMFYDARVFNQDIGDWDVSNVTNMYNMFFNAKVFNQDIGGWDVSSAIDMQSMFAVATDFNQDIGRWNVANVTNMAAMFHSADSFNQDISSWDVRKVNICSNFSRSAKVFQPANKPTFNDCTE